MKSFVSRGIIAGLLFVPGLALAQAGDPLAGLKAADAEMQKAVVDRDVEKIVALYADDAVMLPAAEPTINGKAAIRAEWQHILAIPDFENTSTLVAAETSAGGDLGYTTGTYLSRMRGENGEMVAALLDNEATVKTFQRKDGQVWLLPHNEAYSPIDGTHAQILGKVVAVMRRV